MTRTLAVAVAFFSAATTLAMAQDSRAADVILVGLHGGVGDTLIPAFAARGISATSLDADALAADPGPRARAAVVLVQPVRTERRADFDRSLADATRARPALRVFALSASPGAVVSTRPSATSPIEADANLVAYYAGSSEENLRRLAAYVAKTYLGRDAEVEPPASRTILGVRHPDAPKTFADTAGLLDWARASKPSLVGGPRAAVVVHSTHLAFQQPAVVKALVAAFERRGVFAAAFVDGGEGLTALKGQYEANLLAFAPDVVVHTCHAMDAVAFREKLDAPHVHSIFLGRDSIDDWRRSDYGLDGRTVAFQILTQELLGAIEPIVGGGTLSGRGSGEAITPIPDRIEHVAARAARWAALRRKANADKKIAIVYYDRELDPSALMRGSTTGMFMNAPRSLVAVLERMERDGYRLKGRPKEESALLAAMQRGGRQIGMWAPETLDREVREGDPVLIPVADYVRRFEREVPPERRAEVVARWGAPPGDIMTWRNERGERFIVLPRIDLGGVCLLPQPLRGEAHDPKLLHDKTAPPPHNYLATYFWLRDGCDADAVVHFGTHGSEFFFPGKRTGLAADDWCEILIGDLPNVCPWIVTNLGEVAPAKRRTNAVVVSHDGPPLVEAGLSDDLQAVHDDLEKLLALDDGALKEKFRGSVSSAARKLRLTDDLGVPAGDAPLDDDALLKLDLRLHEIREEKTPTSLHLLGSPPPDELLVPYVLSCLKRKFLDALAPFVVAHDEHEHGPQSPETRAKAEEVVAAIVRRGLSNADALKAAGLVVPEPSPAALGMSLDLARDLGGRMARAGEELDGFMAALAGRFVRPGPGGGPARNPASIPGGRNLFLVNPEEIPARQSFELGKKLVGDYVADFLKRNGRYPTRLAFSLNASATFQDYGVLESEILAALGCEPVWDEKNVVSDVRVLSRAELGRPRVDVFLRGAPTYLDTLAGRMSLIDRAIRAVAALDESDNTVRTETARIEGELRAGGMDAARAATLSRARIFGGAPDSTGNADLYYRVERSGSWETREDLADAYLADFRYAYTEGAFGVEAADALKSAAHGVDAVLRTWTDPVRSPLTDKYMCFHGGTLALAIERLTGSKPEFVVSDVRDPDQARTVAAEDAIASDLRARLFNKKWVEGMMREGYAGADQLAVYADNAFGWSTMRAGALRDDQWNRMKEVLVDDALDLKLREFFERENPHALQEVLETMLESARKGYWNADAATLGDLARALKESVAKHGEGNGLRGAGNDALTAFVRGLNGPGPTPPASSAQPASSAGGGAPPHGAAAPAPGKAAPPIVSGPRLSSAPKPEVDATTSKSAASDAILPVVGVGVVLFLAGFSVRRRR